MRETTVKSVLLPEGDEATPVDKIKATIDNDAIKLVDEVKIDETITLKIKSLAVIHCVYDEEDGVDPHDEYLFEDMEYGKMKTSSPTFYKSMQSLINALDAEGLTIFDVPIVVKRHKSKNNEGSFFSISL